MECFPAKAEEGCPGHDSLASVGDGAANNVHEVSIKSFGAKEIKGAPIPVGMGNPIAAPNGKLIITDVG